MFKADNGLVQVEYPDLDIEFTPAVRTHRKRLIGAAAPIAYDSHRVREGGVKSILHAPDPSERRRARIDENGPIPASCSNRTGHVLYTNWAGASILRVCGHSRRS